MAIESIAKTLGSGSGIDIGALVTSLVDAQFAAKTAELTRREEKLSAQISGVSTLKNAITDFGKALAALSKGGTLSTAPVSADETAIKVTAKPGSDVGALNTSVGVTQLASVQAATTNASYAPTATFKEGTLRLTFGRYASEGATAITAAAGMTAAPNPVTVAIGVGETLETIAGRINAAAGGRVTATLIKDGAGSRLSIKGADGADKAFEIAAADNTPPVSGGDPGETLTGLNVDRNVAAGGTGAFVGVRARDAIVTIDGAQYTRGSNVIDDLVPGVKLELMKVTAAPVALGASRPTAALGTAVADFVETYNGMLALVKEQDDPLTGALSRDSVVDRLARELRGLSTAQLIPEGAAGAPRTLADLGVRTARDGTLSIDNARLTKVMADFPAALERMFAEATTVRTGVGVPKTGLPAVLGALADRVAGGATGFGASAATYAKQKQGLEDAKAKAVEQSAALRERLTRQFATMDARTAAYKSTQTFLDNQIKAWNRSDA